MYYYILLILVAIIAIHLYYTSGGLKMDLDNDDHDEFIEERAMPPLLGSNKCTWGPSYFCDNANNAKECGILNYEEDCAKYKTPAAAP